MAKLKTILKFAFSVAVALFVLNLIAGAIEAFTPIKVRQYIYTPFLVFFPNAGSQGQ